MCVRSCTLVGSELGPIGGDVHTGTCAHTLADRNAHRTRLVAVGIVYIIIRRAIVLCTCEYIPNILMNVLSRGKWYK